MSLTPISDPKCTARGGSNWRSWTWMISWRHVRFFYSFIHDLQHIFFTCICSCIGSRIGADSGSIQELFYSGNNEFFSTSICPPPPKWSCMTATNLNQHDGTVLVPFISERKRKGQWHCATVEDVNNDDDIFSSPACFECFQRCLAILISLLAVAESSLVTGAPQRILPARLHNKQLQKSLQ